MQKIPPDNRPPRRFSVADYHKMIDAGILTPDDRVELLEGWIVKKVKQSPPHCSTISRVISQFRGLCRDNWTMHVNSPVTLDDSEPEPSITLARGPLDFYDTRHPGPADICVLIEVGDSNALADRRYKGTLYARAN